VALRQPVAAAGSKFVDSAQPGWQFARVPVWVKHGSANRTARNPIGSFRTMETKKRSLLKSVSYRLFASIVTATIVYLATGQLLLAAGLGALDSVVKILVFFLHERLWMLIPFGRIKHPLEEIQVNKPLTQEDKKIIEAQLKNMGYLGENI
jgi:uncharacterized membrane protein